MIGVGQLQSGMLRSYQCRKAQYFFAHHENMNRTALHFYCCIKSDDCSKRIDDQIPIRNLVSDALPHLTPLKFDPNTGQVSSV